MSPKIGIKRLSVFSPPENLWSVSKKPDWKRIPTSNEGRQKERERERDRERDRETETEREREKGGGGGGL